MHLSKICKGIATLATISTIASFVPLSISVNAAGIIVSISPSSKNVSTTGTTTISYTTSGPLAAGSTILLSYDSTFPGVLSIANTAVNTVTPTSITNSTSSGRTSSTITLANTIASGTVTISTTALTSPAAAGNYSFTVTSSIGDVGASYQYVGKANEVLIRGTVLPTLSFGIVNAAATAPTNLCDMGNLTTVTIGTCTYRTRMATNAINGYVLSVSTSGNFSSGTNFIPNAAVGTGGTGGTTLVAGTAGYGVIISKGSTTSASATTLATAFDSGSTSSVSYVPTAATPIITSAGPNNPAPIGDITNTSLITHSATIASDTPFGQYTQTATYTAMPLY